MCVSVWEGRERKYAGSADEDVCVDVCGGCEGGGRGGRGSMRDQRMRMCACKCVGVCEGGGRGGRGGIYGGSGDEYSVRFT